MSTTYPFDEPAAAAASSNTIAEAVRKLGREPSPRRNEYVTRLMRRHGIDTRLGAREVGGTQAYIGRRLRKYEIDISHFASRRQSGRAIDGVCPAEFAVAVGQARSIAEVARILGVADNAAFRQLYRHQVMEQGLDVAHVLGQAHARGARGNRRRSPAEILIADLAARGRVKTRLLRSAMIEIGIHYGCAICGTGPDWCGHRITLEIDHISGDITDNRPQNLRFLCPNCHATTPGYCRKRTAKQDAPTGSLSPALGSP